MGGAFFVSYTNRIMNCALAVIVHNLEMCLGGRTVRNLSAPPI